MINSDEYYIKAYIDGDNDAFEILIRQNLKIVYSFVFYLVGDDGLAEDITQETFVKVWKNIKKYDTNKKFKSWILSIARNTTIDWLRKRKNSVFSEFADSEGKNLFEENILDEEPLADEIFFKSQNAEDIKKHIQNLSPKYKEVLFLHYNEEMSFDEISEILKSSPNTIRSRHRRAIIQLNEMHQKETSSRI